MTPATAPAPAFPALSSAHEALRDDAAELARRFAGRAGEVRRHVLDRGQLHPELWREFGDRGWAGLAIPAEHGGTEGGLLGLALVLEELAAANVLLWMPVLSAAIAHAIAQAGPDTARAAWLPRVAAGEASLALAATEPESGHNLFRARTEVRREGERFVVNGVKAVTSGIDLAERVLVFGRAPRTQEDGPAQYTTVLVDPRADGVSATELPMRGREGVKQFRLELRDVEVPLEGLVGVEGQGLLSLWPFTHVERLLTAALCLGSARFCLTRAVQHAGQRQIFGSLPIGAEQAIQHPLARLHSRLEAARLLVHRAAARFDAGLDGFAVAGEANMAKVLTADLVFEAADHAVQTLGASAWDEREGMVDVFLDARLARSGPISQELALNFVAQHVLGLPTHR